jgi:hypothetical protein
MSREESIINIAFEGGGSNNDSEVVIESYSFLQEIVFDIMEQYKEELEDKNSRYYKLFLILGEVNSTEAFEIFSAFFINIYREYFTIEDYFIFLDNENIDISYESIAEYITEFKNNKIQIMLKRLKNGLYKEYGNIFDYIEKRKMDKDDTIFYRVESLQDNLFKTSEKFLLNPYISYFNINAYRNKIQAEKDY